LQASAAGTVLGTGWGTEELGWNRGSWFEGGKQDSNQMDLKIMSINLNEND
jgi:hypothetical protein